MRTRNWILLLCALLLICVVLSAVFLMGDQADLAQVYSDGQLLCTLDLGIDQTKTVKSEYGENVITVRDGKLAVTHADCPDKYCMKRGFCGGGAPIVCLPNRLVIQFAAEQEIDWAVG